MRRSHAFVWIAALCFGCTGRIDGARPGGDAPAPAPVVPGASTVPTATATAMPGATMPAAPGPPPPGTPPPPSADALPPLPAMCTDAIRADPRLELPPARVVRLTEPELNASLGPVLFGNRPAPPFVLGDAGLPRLGERARAVDRIALDLQLESAGTVAERAGAFLMGSTGCAANLSDDACLVKFVGGFARRAWRRPMTADESGRYLTVMRAVLAANGLLAALKASVQAILSSPHFVYRSEIGGPASNGVARLTPHEVAAKLAFFYTGAPPDPTLDGLADSGDIQKPDVLAAQARRLQKSAAGPFLAFTKRWLGLHSIEYFAYTIGTMMTGEFETLVQRMFTDVGTLDALLLPQYDWINGPVAERYKVPGYSGFDWKKTDFPPRRGSLLSMGYVLENYGHGNESAPIVRGKSVLVNVLCQAIPPPLAGVDLTIPKPIGAETTREKYQRVTGQAPCNACHDLINGVGYGWEEFDGVGGYRTTDNGKPVNTAGVLRGSGSTDGPFDGVLDMTKKLARSEVAQRCFVSTMAGFALSAPAGPCATDALIRSFQAKNRDIRELMVDVATSDAFSLRAK